MNLPTWTPRFLARALGQHHAIEDVLELAGALQAARADAWADQSADAATAQKALTGLLNFQPGLLDLHREQAQTTAYLHSLAGAAEANLDFADTDQHALYWALLDAARQAGELQELLRYATTRTLGTSTTALFPVS